jgi:hypothetical protein
VNAIAANWIKGIRMMLCSFLDDRNEAARLLRRI